MTVPTLAQITDYAEEAATRPLEQYQGKPRFLALLLSFIQRCQELEQSAWDVILKRMIDNAQNAQLDVIGKIVGQLRGTQSDAVYRIYITARIRINRSQGHPDDVIDVLQLIEPALLDYTEFYPASALLTYGVTTTDPAILLELASLAVAAGVRLYLIDEDDADALLMGDDTPGGELDTAHGLSDDGGTVGGNAAGLWG